MKMKQWFFIGAAVLLSNVAMANLAVTPKSGNTLCKLGFIQKSIANFSSCTPHKGQLCAKLCNRHSGMCSCRHVESGNVCSCADGVTFNYKEDAVDYLCTLSQVKQCRISCSNHRGISICIKSRFSKKGYCYCSDGAVIVVPEK